MAERGSANTSGATTEGRETPVQKISVLQALQSIQQDAAGVLVQAQSGLVNLASVRGSEREGFLQELENDNSLEQNKPFFAFIGWVEANFKDLSKQDLPQVEVNPEDRTFVGRNERAMIGLNALLNPVYAQVFNLQVNQALQKQFERLQPEGKQLSYRQLLDLVVSQLNLANAADFDSLRRASAYVPPITPDVTAPNTSPTDAATTSTDLPPTSPETPTLPKAIGLEMGSDGQIQLVKLGQEVLPTQITTREAYTAIFGEEMTTDLRNEWEAEIDTFIKEHPEQLSNEISRLQEVLGTMLTTGSHFSPQELLHLRKDLNACLRYMTHQQKLAGAEAQPSLLKEIRDMRLNTLRSIALAQGILTQEIPPSASLEQSESTSPTRCKTLEIDEAGEFHLITPLFEMLSEAQTFYTIFGVDLDQTILQAHKIVNNYTDPDRQHTPQQSWEQANLVIGDIDGLLNSQTEPFTTEQLQQLALNLRVFSAYVGYFFAAENRDVEKAQILMNGRKIMFDFMNTIAQKQGLLVEKAPAATNDLSLRKLLTNTGADIANLFNTITASTPIRTTVAERIAKQLGISPVEVYAQWEKAKTDAVVQEEWFHATHAVVDALSDLYASGALQPPQPSRPPKSDTLDYGRRYQILTEAIHDLFAQLEESFRAHTVSEEKVRALGEALEKSAGFNAEDYLDIDTVSVNVLQSAIVAHLNEMYEGNPYDETQPNIKLTDPSIRIIRATQEAYTQYLAWNAPLEHPAPAPKILSVDAYTTKSELAKAEQVRVISPNLTHVLLTNASKRAVTLLPSQDQRLINDASILDLTLQVHENAAKYLEQHRNEISPEARDALTRLIVIQYPNTAAGDYQLATDAALNTLQAMATVFLASKGNAELSEAIANVILANVSDVPTNLSKIDAAGELLSFAKSNIQINEPDLLSALTGFTSEYDISIPVSHEDAAADVPITPEVQEAVFAAVDALEQQSEEGAELVSDNLRAHKDIAIDPAVFTIAKTIRSILQTNLVGQPSLITNAALEEAAKSVPLPENPTEEVSRYVQNARYVIALVDLLPKLVSLHHPYGALLTAPVRSQLQTTIKDIVGEKIHSLTYEQIAEIVKNDIGVKPENITELNEAYKTRATRANLQIV